MAPFGAIALGIALSSAKTAYVSLIMGAEGAGSIMDVANMWSIPASMVSWGMVRFEWGYRSYIIVNMVGPAARNPDSIPK